MEKRCPSCGRFLYAVNDQTVCITGSNGQHYESGSVLMQCKCGYEEEYTKRWWEKFLT